MPDEAMAPAIAPADIPRSATCCRSDGSRESRPLSAWSDLEAFVLLAEPGGGKSCAFKLEAVACGGAYTKARDFANRGAPDGWQGEPLFIDGLDEMRADAASRNGPLDRVIRQLNELRRPPFRLSCREADWLAAVDHEPLSEVAADKKLEVLHLDPLDDAQIAELLRRHADRVPDPFRFQHEAESRGLDGLLRNPLLLQLLVEAVGSDWPRGRADVYRLACERMAEERNPNILAVRAATAVPIDQTLNDAGLLCAVLLLAGLDAWVVELVVDPKAEAFAQSMPASLGIVNLHATLSSKLFIAEGARRLPRHRSIAEYLAARAIGRLVTQHGLPLSRVLALMSGQDGGIVEPLRGLSAWLAALCASSRAVLIERDPLACVLYGDVHAFATQDKCRVLDGLRREADQFVWFRRGNWAAHPFGALGTVDMLPTFMTLLSSADRSPAHQSLLDCVLDAVERGEAMPALRRGLEAIVRDGSYRADVRNSALDAWLAQSSGDLAGARAWLEDIQSRAMTDLNSELCGSVLDALYPAHLTPAEALRHFRVGKSDNFFGAYRTFWSFRFLDRTPEHSRSALADALVARSLSKRALHAHVGLPQLVGRWIGAALKAAGPSVYVARANAWLNVGIDEHGFAALKGDDSEHIRRWLEQHPDVQKALALHAYVKVEPDPQTGRFHFWECEQILYEAQRPRDWYRWLLDLAASSTRPHIVEFAVREAALAVLHRPTAFDITMEDVEWWVHAHCDRWPKADEWLESVWSSSMQDYRSDQHRRQLKHEEAQAKERVQRRANFAKHLVGIESGQAPARVMYCIALAYRSDAWDVRGDTPEDRVCQLIAGDSDETSRAIAGLEATLSRSDLPSVADILALDLEGQQHHLRPACILGAELAFARDSTAPLSWDDELVHRLVAFRLTDGGNSAGWYELLAEHRPQLVAQVLIAYAGQCLMQRAEQSITGLWPLAHEDAHAALARIVIPPLLRDFPERARPAQVRRLNGELLPAAARHLTADSFTAMLKERLALTCMDSSQRMAWLTAGMRFAAHQRSGQLTQLVGKSRVRALRLGATLQLQMERKAPWPSLPALVLGRLFEVLGPFASPDYPTGAGWVGPADRLRDLVRGLVNQLANSEDAELADEIRRLRQLPELTTWRVAFDAALFDHVRVVRNARYAHAGASAVAQMLSRQSPANTFDLAALVGQHLRDLQARLHGDDTNSLKRFWRDPIAKKPLQPRIENGCRDLLLALLRDRFELQGVTLHKEAAHANDTRADLRAEAWIEGVRKVLPIEIKKDDHPQLWTSWRDQLEGRYMTDPAADGVGLYLVLWFGCRTTRHKGAEPTTAFELEKCLRDTIPHEARERLQVIVMDLSSVAKAKVPGTAVKRAARKKAVSL